MMARFCLNQVSGIKPTWFELRWFSPLRFKTALIPWSLILLTQLFVGAAQAGQANIAVAANFAKTIEVLGDIFNRQSGHRIKFSAGPTGKLYAQIRNGAPFDAYFAADEKRPLRVIADGLADQQQYFVYAEGKIALYSPTFPVHQSPLVVLKKGDFRYLAIANPKTAPYGDRAVFFLKQKGLYSGLRSKLVNGESVGNAFRYLVTGNAKIGFVALSQLVDIESPLYQKGHYWVVPEGEYLPIKQGAVLLKRGEKNRAAVEFMAFMQTKQARDLIQRYGYQTATTGVK